jgi:hypothetical protein
MTILGIKAVVLLMRSTTGNVLEANARAVVPPAAEKKLRFSFYHKATLSIFVP